MIGYNNPSVGATATVADATTLPVLVWTTVEVLEQSVLSSPPPQEQRIAVSRDSAAITNTLFINYIVFA